MSFIDLNMPDIMSTGTLAEARLREVRSRIGEATGSINSLEADLIHLLMFPELIKTKNDNNKDYNGSLEEFINKNIETLDYFYRNPDEIKDKLSGFEDFKIQLQGNEYYFSEIVEIYKRAKQLGITEEQHMEE